jgi:SAM-dependent methyltransferase
MTEVKKQLTDKLVFDEEGFRMSTPSQIAEYKAKRLKTDSIADLGSGIGVQSLYFAQTSRHVVAVENNLRRLEECRKNAELMGLVNIEFIEGNATEKTVIDRLEDVEVVHSDPSRKKTGEVWTFADLSPNPLEIARLYRQENISFDIPAFMHPNLIPNEWELEYISLHGELKRLSTYLGGVKKFDKSALTLPIGKRIVHNKDVPRKVEPTDRPHKWLYDLDGSIFYSGLLPEFLDERKDLELLYQDRQKTLLTSEKFIIDPFIVRSYSVNDTATSLNEVKRKLIDEKAAKVVLRYPIDPSKYYEERRIIERGLDGTTTIYIFKFKDRYYLAERTGEQDSQEH